MRSTRETFRGLAFLLTLTTLAAPASADDWNLPSEIPGPQVEVYLSSLFANSASEGSFGLRGSRFLTRRWAVEGSVARVDDRDVDLWLLDASAKYYLRFRERTRLYLVGGPGLFYSSDLGAEELFLHTGFGSELNFGRKLYLRPELRWRFLAEDFDANFGELSLGLGWRF